MAKSNSNKSARVSLDDIAINREKLQAELAKLQEQENELRNARLKDIEEKINALPEQFGVASLEDVRNLITRHVRGLLFTDTQGKVGERAARVSLSDEQKAALIDDRKAGMQYSALAEKYGISTQTAFNYSKAAGLTVARPSAGDSETPNA